MELTRHRDYRLTATAYTDMRLIDTFGAAAGLPDWPAPDLCTSGYESLTTS